MKLVRDRIPEIIKAAGNWLLTRRVCGIDEHMVMLRAKMVEETDEFLADPSYEEAADMLEVLLTLCILQGLEFDTVIKTADIKRNTNGSFTNGIILQEVGKNENR